jgi:hypothetical protein
MVGDHLDHRVPVDFDQSRRADRADEMVDRPKQKGMQAEEVAGNKQGQDLSPAVRQAR